VTLSQDLLDVVVPLVTGHEGRRLGVYKDSLGIATIGVGFNLEQPGAAAVVADIGADYAALVAGTAELTDTQCDELLNRSLLSVAGWLNGIFPSFQSFSVRRQAALIDMGFMGQGHFEGFRKLIADIDAGNWPAAGAEEMASEWAVEVGSRAHDDLMLMVQG
jgi:GH24 family phage-related lysozyme (muramidase)